jgi:hypothetical protein
MTFEPHEPVDHPSAIASVAVLAVACSSSRQADNEPAPDPAKIAEGKQIASASIRSATRPNGPMRCACVK